MSELLLQSLALGAGSCHPDCVRARNEQEDHNASQSAAMVAVNLISSARVILKLDTEFTEYSAQYLVDNAGPKKEGEQGETNPQHCEFTIETCLQYLRDNVWNKKEDGQREMGQQRCELTVKDCLQFALKEGLPKAEHWAHLGCTFKPPPFAGLIPRVPMKGEVVEAKNLNEALKLLKQQPVGAKLHVLSPELDRLLGEDGIYDGPSGILDTRYVGLRDVIIVAVERIKGDPVATVKICYKKKTSFVKVSLSRMFLRVPHDGVDSQVIGPTGLLVDFCVPRLSTQ